MNIKDLNTNSYTVLNQPKPLNINDLPKDSYSPVIPTTSITPAETNPQRFGMSAINLDSNLFKGEPSFPATGNVVKDIAGIVGNIPSSAISLVRGIATPVNPLDIKSPVNIGSNIVGSASALKDIFQYQNPLKGTKSILGGFADTYLKVGEAIYGGLDKAYNALLDDPKKATADVSSAVAKIGIEDPLFIPSLLYGGGETAGAKENLISKLSKVVTKEADTSLANLAKQTETIVSDAKNFTKAKFETKYVGDTIKDWERVGGDYVKTDKLLAQEEARLKNPNTPKSVKDTPTFLSEQGISPQSLIGSDNKFGTLDIAKSLTSDAVKPYEEILNKQLKVVQQGQPLTQISELKQPLLDSIKNVRGVTADVQENLAQIAENKLSALERKYPKGIPLDELNVEKGNFWKTTKFDLTKPLDPQVNYQIGTAIKDLIETKAGDANVSELNGILGNYYKAGKFLQGLENRVPKITTGQKITRGITKGVSTFIGAKLFGLEGGVGGFLLSKSISHILENASNPLKTFILNNLEKTNPKAYQEAINWLGKQEAERLSRLSLPSPNMSTKGTPIPSVITPPAPTTFEKPAEVIRRQ